MYDKIYCFSYTLKEVLKAARHEGNRPLLERIVASLDEHCAKIQAWLDARQSSSRLCRQLYAQLDRFIEEEKPKAVSCRSGCAHCCKQLVAVTRSEAVHLVRVARATGVSIDEGLLTRQENVDDEGWLKLPIVDKACVFLDPATQVCRVYRDRPLACRKYHVVSEPALCNIDQYPKGRAHVWYQMDAEIIQTAWMTVDGADSLPNLLLKELRAKGGAV